MRNLLFADLRVRCRPHRFDFDDAIQSEHRVHPCRKLKYGIPTADFKKGDSIVACFALVVYELTVMTVLYTRFRRDDVFLQEHSRT